METTFQEIDEDQTGVALNLQILDEHAPDYGLAAARALIKALRVMELDGQCDCFAGDGFMFGPSNSYLIGLSVRSRAPQKEISFTRKDWLGGSKRELRHDLMAFLSSLLDELDEQLNDAGCGLKVDKQMSELTMVYSINSCCSYVGSALFASGVPVALNEKKTDSSFECAVTEAMNTEG